jgi:hypothetical protein
MGLFDEEIVHKENHTMEDRILLKAACEGCKDSLATIYGRYGPAVHDYLMRACPFGKPEKNLNLFGGVHALDHLAVIPRHPVGGI